MKFLKADTAFMNIRPFRYSVVLEPRPDSMTPVSPSLTKRHLRLQDAILSSYHHNEVRYRNLILTSFKENLICYLIHIFFCVVDSSFLLWFFIRSSFPSSR